jgi:hypothetical protein
VTEPLGPGLGEIFLLQGRYSLRHRLTVLRLADPVGLLSRVAAGFEKLWWRLGVPLKMSPSKLWFVPAPSLGPCVAG